MTDDERALALIDAFVTSSDASGPLTGEVQLADLKRAFREVRRGGLADARECAAQHLERLAFVTRNLDEAEVLLAAAREVRSFDNR
jgi:hypothetical protein